MPKPSKNVRTIDLSGTGTITYPRSTQGSRVTPEKASSPPWESQTRRARVASCPGPKARQWLNEAFERLCTRTVPAPCSTGTNRLLRLEEADTNGLGASNGSQGTRRDGIVAGRDQLRLGLQVLKRCELAKGLGNLAALLRGNSLRRVPTINGDSVRH
jgi:hypothetical protein